MVYPNPTPGHLNIRLTDALQANSSLNVTDVTGRTVKLLALPANSINIHLDVKDLPAGRYFIRIINNTQLINQSFVVIK
ncbi:MAG: T9SS type A sorting domain-containing protein [Ferruginibacter sp.]